MQSSHRWHRFGAALLMGLTLIIAACGGSTSGGGGQPTPTSKPTAAARPSSTPVPFKPWRIVSSPNVTNPYPFPASNELNAVSALSSSDAWAVGGEFAGAPGPASSLIEWWDGTAWRLVANPGPGNLYGVAAVSAHDVWAVGRQGGYYNDSYRVYVYTTLIMHWNGSQWSVVPSPNPDTSGSYLTSVTAIAANNIWAVGYTGTLGPGSGEALIEHWDGKAWGVVSSPRPAETTGSVYTAVTRIPGTNHLWAVGYAPYRTIGARTTGYLQPLIERWDGSAWHIVAGPPLPSDAFSTTLNSVVALSATDAWAVGDYIGSDHTTHPLIAHWDGASWKVVRGPNQPGSLTSVTAAGEHDVRAVGHIVTGDTNNPRLHLLIEQWNGVAWQVAPSPEPSGAEYSGLDGVTTDGDGAYWAVGDYRPKDNRSNLTLIARCP
ncbi:MAG TPA: hypothetical protein VFU88_04030 [Ktedonobacterales bacterium]|nr:hypothetical protein [Ktedonobacterales bacterium]